MYSAFWTLTLAMKLYFDYFMLIVPIVEPTRKLLALDLYCWRYNNLYGDCNLDTVDLFNVTNNHGVPDDHTRFNASGSYVHIVRWLRMNFYSIALIGLRWFTPLCIMIADTILIYTLVAAVWSGLVGYYYKIAEVVEWCDMVRRVEDSVRLLNTRLLADPNRISQQELMQDSIIDDGHDHDNNHAHSNGGGGLIERASEIGDRLAALFEGDEEEEEEESDDEIGKVLRNRAASPPPSPPGGGEGQGKAMPAPARLPPTGYSIPLVSLLTRWYEA